MEGIKYVNWIEIGPVVIEIPGVENGELAVPVNNTLVHHSAFLATDTRLCVLTRVTCRNTLLNNSDDQHFVSQTCFHCQYYCVSLCVQLVM